MYPHERKMVEEYAGKPFAILGVNTDSSDTLSQIVQDKKVTWRCWADGRNGPISQAWQIESYPALFLLDHEGVIRKTYAGRPNEDDLTKDIKDLIEKAPSKTP
jgi:cytochrome oxidase Cu insertion factor (SCO1/SenC/PrrC family)